MCLTVCIKYVCVQKNFYAFRVFCMHPCECGGLLFHSACTCTTCGTQFQTVSDWNACGLLCVAFFHSRPRRLNVDYHDVSSKPQSSLLCVTVTIYFRPVCEKQLSFHLRKFTDTDSWIEHCATVTGPEPPPPKWMCSLIFTLTQLIQNNWRGKTGTVWTGNMGKCLIIQPGLMCSFM